ncbi:MULTISPECIES: hypothetical protein [Aliarcobacter]|uniref:hypothetical protein n=1 Tax=Aliarcobacter TaxID=2321111 RepID=UPI0021B3B0FB|nr:MULTISPECIES: hypothetical protein [Aliarcobacter]MCT7473661.1 hypothetical protein [Aliarcobacter cryaerophilus]MCT7602145.1 hypothetical protein [Aliarcobacter butzleri]
MKNYLFFTSEGFTYDPKNKEIQNMQILGDATGNDVLEAFKNFKINQPYLKNFSFTNVMAIQTIDDVIRNLELGGK